MEVVNYIENFLNGIDFSTPILAITDDSVNATISVCDLYYARKGLIIKIDGKDYTILSVDYVNSTITLKGLIAPIPHVMIAKLQPLFYFHGTPLAVNSELSAIPFTSKKTPMLYVYEIIREDYDLDILSSIEKRSDVKMVFLDDSSEQITTDEHYQFVITPLANLVDKFIFELKRDKRNLAIKELANYKRINHVRFGTYTDGKGHEKRIFQDQLTGIEVSLTLPFIKKFECKKC